MNDPGDYRGTHQGKEHGAGYDERYGKGFKHFFWTEVERPLLEQVLARLREQHSIERALDFACGTGRILQLLEQSFPETTGIDISQPMLQQAAQRCPRSTLVCVDATDPAVVLDPNPGPFDLVTSFRFFLKAQDSLRHQALDFIAGVLRPGGLLVVNTHNQPLSPHGLRSALLEKTVHSRQEPRLSWQALVELASSHGFEHLEHHPLGFLPGVKNHLILPGSVYRKLDSVVARSSLGDRVCQNAIVVLRRA